MLVSAVVIEKRRQTQVASEAGTTHADQAGRALTEALAPHRADGEPAIDGAALLRQLARLLVAAQSLLDEADIAHQRELSDDQDPRDRKEKFGTQTYNALVKARGVIELLGGAEATRAAGFDGPTPRSPDVLADLAPKVAERLPAVAAKLPAQPGVTVDVDALVAGILAPVPDLRTARADGIREDKEAEATLVNKWRKLEGHDLTLRVASGITALVMELGGFTELADRLHAPVRRAGAAAAADAGTGAGTPTP